MSQTEDQESDAVLGQSYEPLDIKEEKEDEGDIVDDINVEHIPRVADLRARDDVTLEELLGYIELYQEKKDVLDAKVHKLKESKKEVQKKHRGSVIDLHNRMFKKLIETESEQKTELQTAQEKVSELETEVSKFQMLKAEVQASERGDTERFQSDKLQEYVEKNARLEKENQAINERLKQVSAELKTERMKQERTSDSHRKSISTLHTNMFKKLLDAEDEFQDKLDREISEKKKLEKEIQREKLKNEQSDKLRRDSVQTVHNQMLSKILDAQAEHEEEKEALARENKELKRQLKEARFELRKEALKSKAQSEKRAERDTGSTAMYGDQAQSSQEDEDSDDSAVSELDPAERRKDLDDGNKEDELVVDPTEYLRMKDELKRKSTTIQENKAKIFDLTKDLEAAQLKWQNEEKQRRSSVSFLSKQMMAKLLEAEEENEDQKQKFKQKLQRLEKELEESKEMSFNLEKTRRNSVTKVSQGMFAKLLSAEQSKKEMEQNYKAQIKRLEEQLAVADLEKTTIGSREHMISMQMDQWKEKAETS